MERQQFIFINISTPQWLVYSAVLLLAIFFRFSRIWSVRNLDLLLLLTLSGTIVVSATLDPQAKPLVTNDATENDSLRADSATKTPDELPSVAPPNIMAPSVDPIYRWVTVAGLILSVLLVVRLIFDESLTRRPRLEQNMNKAGLTFLLVLSLIHI